MATPTPTTHETAARTTAQAAAQIRRQLKARGWTRHHVSVRSESYSLGSSIHVTIRSADAPRPEVEEIARQFERVDRDDSGEILSGGNRLVFVEYDHELRSPLRADIESRLSDDGEVVIAGYVVFRDDRGIWHAYRRNSDRRIDAHHRDSLAHQLSVRLLDEGLASAVRDREPEPEKIDPDASAYLALAIGSEAA